MALVGAAGVVLACGTAPGGSDEGRDLRGKETRGAEGNPRPAPFSDSLPSSDKASSDGGSSRPKPPRLPSGPDPSSENPGTSTGVNDGAVDGGDGGARPSAGHCSRVSGPECDLVAQDCAPVRGVERHCVAVKKRGGDPTTACVPVEPHQRLAPGAPCCREDNGTDACGRGTTCIGGESCQAGRPPTGRCAPVCCPGDDAVCGVSPSGEPGRCTMGIVDEGATEPLFHVCTYHQVCQPLGVQPCGSGSACHVTDPSGSAACVPIYSRDGAATTGLGFGESCAAANACADGLECLSGTPGSGGRCEMLCHVRGRAVPFDASRLDDTVPGRGGCPRGAPTCTPAPGLLPSWLGVCQ